MKPSDQLPLQFEAAPPLVAKYPNYIGWRLSHARGSVPVWDSHRSRHKAIWQCACGKVMTGIKGATQ